MKEMKLHIHTENIIEKMTEWMNEIKNYKKRKEKKENESIE